MLLAPAENMSEEIIAFLAQSASAEDLVNYQSPEATQQHLNELLDKNDKTSLSDSEQTGLEEFLRLNRFMSRLRLKAKLRLK